MDKSFKGVLTMGGRMNGMDCAVCNQDINGKVRTTCTRTTHSASAAP